MTSEMYIEELTDDCSERNMEKHAVMLKNIE